MESSSLDEERKRIEPATLRLLSRQLPPRLPRGFVPGPVRSSFACHLGAKDVSLHSSQRSLGLAPRNPISIAEPRDLRSAATPQVILPIRPKQSANDKLLYGVPSCPSTGPRYRRNPAEPQISDFRRRYFCCSARP